jgi:hypothetical protein
MSLIATIQLLSEQKKIAEIHIGPENDFEIKATDKEGLLFQNKLEELLRKPHTTLNGEIKRGVETMRLKEYGAEFTYEKLMAILGDLPWAIPGYFAEIIEGA